MSTGRKITLTEDEDWWVAHDETANITSQGKTRTEAIENLDEAVALARGEIGRPPTDEELREAGIDPEDNQPGGNLPSVLGGPESDEDADEDG
jgi:predicted RNase H-like HicB family nuclease